MLVEALVCKARLGCLIKHANRSRDARRFTQNGRSEGRSVRLERSIPIAT